MYSNIYGPYFKNGHYHLHLYLLDGARKYRSFTTEEDALQFVRLNQRRVVTNPITMSDAIDKYLDARTDLRPSSRANLQLRLRVLIKGSEKTSLQLFSAMTAWNRLVRDNAVDTLHGIRSSAKGFFDGTRRSGANRSFEWTKRARFWRGPWRSPTAKAWASTLTTTNR